LKGCPNDRGEEVPYIHPKRAAKVSSKGEVLAFWEKVHPEVLMRYDIPREKAYLFEINFEPLLQGAKEEKRLGPYPDSRLFIGIFLVVVDRSWRREIGRGDLGFRNRVLTRCPF